MPKPKEPALISSEELVELIEEIRTKLHDINQKLDHLIQKRAFNCHDVQESPSDSDLNDSNDLVF